MPDTYSNGDWKKLGDRIRANSKDIAESDLEMLQTLRVAYKEPLAYIFGHLEKVARKIDKYSICTFRVKRIESIISKILRLQEMVICRAEDIAGCRCIVHTEEQVYKIQGMLVKLQDEGILDIKGGGHDYIKEPKPSGYRSLHVIVTPKGDTRKVEIQIRTIDQHNWATLVETTDVLYKSGLKEYSNKKTPELYEFHQLLAIPNDQLSSKDKLRIAEISLKYNYLEKVGSVFKKNYIEVRTKWNQMSRKDKRFILIATDSEGCPDFACFKNYDEAEHAYFDEYMNNSGNKNIVLTHLPLCDFEKISMAYSNYFLMFNNLVVRLLRLLSEAVVKAFKSNTVIPFRNYYKYFNDTISLCLGKQLQDMIAYSNNKSSRNSRKSGEWANSISKNIKQISSIYSDLHNSLRYRIIPIIPYIVYLKMSSDFRKRDISVGN